MTDREQVIAELEYMKRDVLEDSDNDITLNKAIDMLKEQEKRINELEEKLRLLEYGDQDILQSGMMPAT